MCCPSAKELPLTRKALTSTTLFVVEVILRSSGRAFHSPEHIRLAAPGNALCSRSGLEGIRAQIAVSTDFLDATLRGEASPLPQIEARR